MSAWIFLYFPQISFPCEFWPVLTLTDMHATLNWDHPYLLFRINTLRPRQDGRRFADDTFKCIFLDENVRISIKISLKFVPKGPINNIPALIQIMAWRRSGDKPLSESMMVSLPTHICVARPQWVKTSRPGENNWHFADDTGLSGDLVLGLINLLEPLWTFYLGSQWSSLNWRISS